MKWDIFYAGQSDTHESGPIVNPHFKLQKTNWTYCLHSYVLTRKAIVEILSHDFEHNLCVPDEYIPALYSEGHTNIHPNLKHLGGNLKAYNMQTMAFLQEQGTEIGSNKLHSDTENSDYIVDTEDSFFIEIGTSDFNTLVPLAQVGWKGIFVEPLEELLDNLERFEGCIYENCAVLDEMTTMNLHFYDLDWVPQSNQHWTRGVGSLSETNHFNLNPQFKEHERNRDVPVVTLDHLIEKHNVKRIDYLKIDIEGLDYKILDNYSWNIKPKLLKVEYIHWNTHGVDYHQYVKLLEGMGYVVVVGKEDIVGALNE